MILVPPQGCNTKMNLTLYSSNRSGSVRPRRLPPFKLCCCLAVLSLWSISSSEAFLLQQKTETTKTQRSRFNLPVLNYVDDQALGDSEMALVKQPLTLPTLKQVKTDSFTDQTYHASTLVNQMYLSSSASESNEDDEDQTTTTTRTELVQELVSAQLSHNDGLRGFLAVYLTYHKTYNHHPAYEVSQAHWSSSEDITLAADAMPKVLTQAIKTGANMTNLAPLICMNMIRPIAISLKHTDPTLKQNSLVVAHRAKLLLSELRGSINVIKHYQAVYAVASGSLKKNLSSKSSSLELFWEAVFQESGYNEEQRKAIAAAFASFIHP